MNGWRLGLLSAWRRPFSSLLAVLCVAVCVVAACRLARLAESVNRQNARLFRGPAAAVTAKGDQLATFLSLQGLKPKTVEPLHPSLQKHLCALPPVSGCLAGLFVAKVDPFPVMALQPPLQQTLPRLGLTLAQGQWPQKEGQTVAGAEVPLPLSASLQPQLLPTRLRPKPRPYPTVLRLVGRLKPTGTQLDQGLYLPLGQDGSDAVLFYMDANGGFATPPPPGAFGFLWLWLRPGKTARDAVEQFTNERSTAQFVDLVAARGNVETLTRTGRLAATAASGFALALCALATAALLMARFEALTTQMAVLRALGRHRREVAGWVLAESLALVLPGVLLGGLLELALPAAWGVAAVLPQGAAPAAGVFPFLFLPWLATLATGLLAGGPVIWRLYRLDTHEALRTL